MGKIGNGFKYFVQVLLVFFLGTILFRTAGYVPDKVNYFSSIFSNVSWVIWFIVILLALTVSFLFKLVDISSEKVKKIIVVSSFALLVISELIILFGFNVIHTTDDYYVRDQALMLARGDADKLDVSSSLGYFSIYGNNYFVVLVSRFIYKICILLGINNTEIAFGLFSVILTTLAIWYLYKFIKLVKGDDFAIKVLLLEVFNPLNALMIYWTYTCVYSLPLMVIGIYAAYKTYIANMESKLVKQIIYGVILGICIVVGYYLRPTVLIPIIALFIVFLFSFTKIKNKKQLLVAAVACLFSICIIYAGINTRINTIVDSRDKNFPVTHWLMLGIHDNYSFDDVQYTASFETKEEKIEGNLKEYFDVCKKLGFSGVLAYYYEKMPITWNDGEASYVNRLRNVRETNFLYNWIAGNKKDWLVCYCQAYRILCLLFAIVSCIRAIIKKSGRVDFLIQLTLLGGILFYTFWEAKTAYSIPFLCFLIVMAADGVEYVNSKDKIVKKYWLAIPVLMVINILLAFVAMPALTKDKVEVKDYSVYSFHSQFVTSVRDIASADRILAQEFKTNKKFNYITIGCAKGEKGATKYTVSLLENDSIIKEWTVKRKDIEDKRIKLNLDKKAEPGCYKLEIKAESAGKDTIFFSRHFSSAYDEYEGYSYLDGEQSNYDMLIQVAMSNKNVLLGRNVYIIFIIIALLGQLLLMLGLRWEGRKIDERKLA